MCGSVSQETLNLLQKWSGTNGMYIPRFRDIMISPEEPIVIIRTRTGGGNRNEYQKANDAMTYCYTYIDNEDCEFDNTYADFKYRIKDVYLDDWKKLVEKEK